MNNEMVKIATKRANERVDELIELGIKVDRASFTNTFVSELTYIDKTTDAKDKMDKEQIINMCQAGVNRYLSNKRNADSYELGVSMGCYERNTKKSSMELIKL